MNLVDTTIDDLTDQQAKFITAWLALGARKGMATKALQQVNPNITPESARTTASHYQRDPKILAAIRNLADASLKANVLLAQDALTDIMEGTFNGQIVKPETALKAAVEILNRGGLMIAQKVDHNVNITDNRTERELLAYIKKTSQDLGIPAGELGIVDAEFDVIDAAAPYGRKTDGMPRARPGRMPYKRRLPPPETDPEKMTPKQLKRHKEQEQVKRVREQLKAARKAKREGMEKCD